ncbi:MAG: VWA domain-containing protein [Bacteroidales bacterium]|nr:VWA domain-containing protein [Bacteroidales bacterium]
MKRILISIVCILAAAVCLSAQPKLKGTVSVGKPASLDRDILKESEAKAVLKAPYGQDSHRTGGSYWVVFSDRKANPVYAEPGSRSKIGELAFGEKLRIAEIKDDWALVYYDPKNDYPRISAVAESKGWLPMSNLLLWDKGLYDNIGISQKAVICADLDQKGKLKTIEGRKRYSSPTASDGLSLPTDMHFYYILKREGGRVLLGNNAVINNGRDFFGWVDEGTFVPWNFRTCLEPTWDIDDVEYFTSKQIQWQVFTNPDLKGTAPSGDVFSTANRVRTEKAPNYVNEYKYRTMPVAYLRYPILEGGNEKMYHCTTFGTLNAGKTTTRKAPATTIDADRARAQSLLSERNKVNIVIVIDGTSSMKPYFNSVKKALNEVDKFFDNAKVNVGVMIYRDKEDKEYVTECFPSTGGFTEPKNQNLRKWLDSGGKYGVKSIAPGNTESVFYGIDKAVDQFFPSTRDMKLQSNILLVIGDCGDNGKFKISSQDLIDKLAAQNISLMGFQVTNKGTEDYDSFNYQITNLMRSSVQKRYDNISTKPQVIKPKRLENGRGYDMNNTEGLNLFLGMHRYNPIRNKPMLEDDLTNSIEEILGIWRRSVDYLTTIAGNLIDIGDQESLAEDDVVGSQLKMDAIIAMLGGDKEMVERLRKQNALLSFRGYARRQQDTRDLFKVIVFFPAGELKNLVRDLEKVYEAAQSESADRKPYYDAMMSLARTAVAQDKISSTSYYEILAKVFGLANYKPKHGYTLDDIVDPNAVPYKEYRKIVKEMQRSVETLKNVTSVDYPFLLTYSGNNDKYYWLPSEYLPL